MSLFILSAGVVGGLLCVALASLFPRHRRHVLAGVLILAAGAYVSFALRRGAGGGWLTLELLGVAIYGALAVLGVRGSRWWLVVGWMLHPLWDIALHFVGPGHAFAPEAYTVSCLSWDLTVAAVLALALLARRATSRMRSTLIEPFEAELTSARGLETSGDLDGAWHSLERAHVLSQAYALPHLRVHGRMAAFALRHLDVRELLGQLPRLVLAAPGSWMGRAPLGNTGGADVGIFTPLPIPTDLRAVLDQSAR